MTAEALEFEVEAKNQITIRMPGKNACYTITGSPNVDSPHFEKWALANQQCAELDRRADEPLPDYNTPSLLEQGNILARQFHITKSELLGELIDNLTDAFHELDEQEPRRFAPKEIA